MTAIWGIVNVTPDSFSDGGRYLDVDRAVAHGLRLRDEGATVLDVGGESTRPGAEPVGAEVEQQRVLPVIEQLVAAGAPVSIDTLHAETAVAAVRAGARFVNDVSGGLADPDMLAAVAETDADYAIGHWRDAPDDMYAHAQYRRTAREVAGELQARMGEAAAAGIAPSRLIVDPGIGFSKRGGQNWGVLSRLDEIVALGPRVLIGTSRKRFLAETIAADPATVSEARRDLATAITSALAVRDGVWAVRVHDVAATHDAIVLAHAWEGR